MDERCDYDIIKGSSHDSGPGTSYVLRMVTLKTCDMALTNLSNNNNNYFVLWFFYKIACYDQAKQFLLTTR